MQLRLVKWYSDDIAKKVQKAAKVALEETAEASAARARANLAGAGGPYYTGKLEGDIGVIGRAESGRRRSWIHWGAANSDHAFFQEVGANGEPGKHFFRSAADAEYPKLAKRIKEHL